MAGFQEDFFSPRPKHKIFYRTLSPENPKGHVLVIHGYGEHSGRYLHVMEYLAERGYASYAPDHRGHGRSARCLGDMDSFAGVVSDLAAFKEHLAARGAAGLFIIGHSLGACLGLSLAGLHPENLIGAVLIAPMVIIPDYVSPFLLAMAKILAALFPRLALQPFEAKKACRDESVLEIARADPLNYQGNMRSRTGYQFLVGMKTAQNLLPRIRLPLLLLHGGADLIMPTQSSRLVYDGAASPDKTLTVLDGFYHEVLNDPGKEKVIALIYDWFEKHRA